MPTVPLAFPMSSNPARFGHAGYARLVNVYPERIGRDGKQEVIWVASDGLASFATLTDGGGIRAMLVTDSKIYVASGRSLYSVDTGGGVERLGGLPTIGMVTMARNRVGQIAIVCDGLYFGIGSDGVYQQLADVDIDAPPISVTVINGQFVFLAANGKMFISDIDDWEVDALNFVTNEARPDGGVRNITRGSDLLGIGSHSTEFWADNGDFTRTAVNDIGCKAGGSVVELEQTIFMVAHDNTLRALDGYQWKRISSHAVERFIAEEPTPALITGCAWQSRGHSFYCISGSGGSWCYDVVTGEWHERQSYGLNRWRVSQTVKFGERVIAGDYNAATLYTMSPDHNDEAGTELVTTISAAPAHANGRRVRHDRIDIDLVPGTGQVTATSHLANPRLMLRWSEDGGASWSTERQIATGAAGQRLQRAFATRLGMSRSRTYEISMSAAVARGFLSMQAQAEIMGN